jgi:septation ring formation regulator EzrA
MKLLMNKSRGGKTMKKIIAVAIATIILQGCYQNDRSKIDIINKRLALIETSQNQQLQSITKIVEQYENNNKQAQEIEKTRNEYIDSLTKTVNDYTKTTENFINATSTQITTMIGEINNNTKQAKELIAEQKEGNRNKFDGALSEGYHIVSIIVGLLTMLKAFVEFRARQNAPVALPNQVAAPEGE